MNDISLSAAAWQTAAQAHAALAAALRFPAYYGGNLDALFDCLRDLDETALTVTHCAAAESDGGVAGSIWLDALSGVLKHVPVYNAVMKEVGHRLLPITNGKIEGASPDKVFYFMAPDNDLRGFRVQRGDLVLVVPAQAAVDGAIMLLQTPQGRVLRKVKRLNDYQAMLQRYDESCESEIKNYNEIMFVGRCVRLEASLEG